MIHLSFLLHRILIFDKWCSFLPRGGPRVSSLDRETLSHSFVKQMFARLFIWKADKYESSSFECSPFEIQDPLRLHIHRKTSTIPTNDGIFSDIWLLAWFINGNSKCYLSCTNVLSPFIAVTEVLTITVKILMLLIAHAAHAQEMQKGWQRWAEQNNIYSVLFIFFYIHSLLERTYWSILCLEQGNLLTVKYNIHAIHSKSKAFKINIQMNTFIFSMKLNIKILASYFNLNLF